MADNVQAGPDDVPEAVNGVANDEPAPPIDPAYFIKIADGREVFGPSPFTLKSKDSSEETLVKTKHRVPSRQELLADPDSHPPAGFFKLIADDGTCFVAPEALVEKWRPSTAKCDRSQSIPVVGLTSDTLAFVLTIYAMFDGKSHHDRSTSSTPHSSAFMNDSSMSDTVRAMYDRLDGAAIKEISAAAVQFEYGRLETLTKDYCESKAKDAAGTTD